MTLQVFEATTGYLFAMRRDGSMAIVFADPRPCSVCGKLHCFFVNRLGSTCCVDCDHERDTSNLMRPLAGNIEVRP